VRPVGSSETSQVDVRVIAGTHRTLSGMVAGGTFRADLYHRLRWMPVAIPPLRDRPDDIPLLIEHFRIRLNPLVDAAVTGFSARALARLQDGAWPGNVRELETTIAQALVSVARGRCRSRTWSSSGRWAPSRRSANRPCWGTRLTVVTRSNGHSRKHSASPPRAARSGAAI
jgi:transcriptional regulator with GAF, ATPase, and Fis domain